MTGSSPETPPSAPLRPWLPLGGPGHPLAEKEGGQLCPGPGAYTGPLAGPPASPGPTFLSCLGASLAAPAPCLGLTFVPVPAAVPGGDSPSPWDSSVSSPAKECSSQVRGDGDRDATCV